MATKKTNAAAAAAAIVRVTVVAVMPVEHDGVRMEPGDEFELDEAQAAPLLAVNAVAPKVAAEDAPAA